MILSLRCNWDKSYLESFLDMLAKDLYQILDKHSNRHFNPFFEDIGFLLRTTTKQWFCNVHKISN